VLLPLALAGCLTAATTAYESSVVDRADKVQKILGHARAVDGVVTIKSVRRARPTA
jgi:hypothetical protein